MELKLPKTNISTILDNPKEWSDAVAERFFEKNTNRIIKAQDLGETFAKSLIRGEDD